MNKARQLLHSLCECKWHYYFEMKKYELKENSGVVCAFCTQMFWEMKEKVQLVKMVIRAIKTEGK